VTIADQAGPRAAKIPERAAELVGRLQVRLSCPRCGKRCYGSRKEARYAARLLRPGTHMIKYQCGTGYWHLTSMTERPRPRRRGRGRRPRAAQLPGLAGSAAA
jgi:hypothetical protein